MAKFLSVPTSSNSEILSKSKINIYDTIPRHILSDSENFIQLLQDYYEFLNERNMPINVITNMVKNSDIDRIDSEFIETLLAETMVDLPSEPSANRTIFYKRVVDFYRTKGTIESFRIFFRVFFNDNIEIFYPKDYTFTLGTNRWDAELRIPSFDEGGALTGYSYGGWINNQGMLSTNQFLTDGRYYQPYSYVIKSGLNITKWQYIFNKVCHPSGFVFYGEVAIFVELLNSNDNLFRIPVNQPGFTRPQELVQKIIIELLKDTPYTESIELYIRKIFSIVVDNSATTNTIQNHFITKYFSVNDIRQYYGLDVSQIDTANNIPGLVIDTGSYVIYGELTTEDNVIITDESDNPFLINIITNALLTEDNEVITDEADNPILVSNYEANYINAVGGYIPQPLV